MPVASYNKTAVEKPKVSTEEAKEYKEKNC